MRHAWIVWSTTNQSRLTRGNPFWTILPGMPLVSRRLLLRRRQVDISVNQVDDNLNCEISSIR
jgi:hypothetical protein